MKHQQLLIVAIAIAVGSLVIWAIQSRELQNQATKELATSDQSKRNAALQSRLGPMDQSSQASAIRRQSQFSNTTRIAIGDPLQKPKTREEVAWLEKNKFPSMEEFQSSNAQQPRVDLSDGISPTEILQASTLATMGGESQREGLKFLDRAAEEGSIFALETLGSVYGPGALNNPIKSEAYYKAAEIMGDWGIAFRMSSSLSKQDEILASLLAQQIINNIDVARQKRGLPPLRRTIRPGLNDQLFQMASEARRQSAKKGGTR